MTGFSEVDSRALHILDDDIDTDQIMPARYLRTASAQGLAPYLFFDRLAGPQGSTFPLHPSLYQGETILMVGSNFGCGSSREHAAWALREFGFRVILGLSFGEIFFSNCTKNGILPIVVEPSIYRELLNRNAVIRVNLDDQTLRCKGLCWTFQIDPFARYCLLQGQGELDFILSQAERIAAFEEKAHTRALQRSYP